MAVLSLLPSFMLNSALLLRLAGTGRGSEMLEIIYILRSREKILLCGICQTAAIFDFNLRVSGSHETFRNEGYVHEVKVGCKRKPYILYIEKTGTNYHRHLWSKICQDPCTAALV